MKTQKFKLWQNSKLKNSNCDKTQKLKLWQNSKKSNCDKTEKLKVLPNSKTLIVTKLKKTNCDKTQKFKLWQNSKTQIVTKLSLWKISIYDKRYFKRALKYEHFDTFTTDEMFSGQLFLLLLCFCFILILSSMGENRSLAKNSQTRL